MVKVFIFSLIFALVVQPVISPASALAAQDLDGDFYSLEGSDSEDGLQEENIDVENPPEEGEASNEAVEDNDEGEDGYKESEEPVVDNPIVEDDITPEERVYISKVYSKDGEEFIEIYNPGDNIYIEELKLTKLTVANGLFTTLNNGVFMGQSHILIKQKPKSYIPLEDIDYDGYFKIDNVVIQSAVIEISINGVRNLFCAADESNCKDKYKTEKNSNTLNNDTIAVNCREIEGPGCDIYEFTNVDKNSIKPSYGGFIPDEDPEVEPDPDSGDSEDQPLEINIPKNPCENLKLNEIAANVDKQFIEIVNSGGELAALDGCVIKTSTKKDGRHIFKDNIELAPGEFYVLELTDSELSIVKTTTRTVYLLSEDEENEMDSILYENLKKETSFSRFIDDESGKDIWRQTYVLTPGEDNLYAEFPACEVSFERNLETGRCRKVVDVQTLGLAECAEGQYRNSETNRCRKIEASTLTPCAPDQYRHPETNRCRKIESLTTTSLTPCKAGQYRHPETNRCRNIPAETTLTPCKDGYERNPETNRCRKIVENTGASDSIDDNTDESADNFTGWVAIGGVGLLAAGVIGWEWKREVYNLLQVLGRKLKFRRR